MRKLVIKDIDPTQVERDAALRCYEFVVDGTLVVITYKAIMQLHEMHERPRIRAEGELIGR